MALNPNGPRTKINNTVLKENKNYAATYAQETGRSQSKVIDRIFYISRLLELRRLDMWILKYKMNDEQIINRMVELFEEDIKRKDG